MSSNPEPNADESLPSDSNAAVPASSEPRVPDFIPIAPEAAEPSDSEEAVLVHPEPEDSGSRGKEQKHTITGREKEIFWVCLCVFTLLCFWLLLNFEGARSWTCCYACGAYCCLNSCCSLHQDTLDVEDNLGDSDIIAITIISFGIVEVDAALGRGNNPTSAGSCNGGLANSTERLGM